MDHTLHVVPLHTLRFTTAHPRGQTYTFGCCAWLLHVPPSHRWAFYCLSRYFVHLNLRLPRYAQHYYQLRATTLCRPLVVRHTTSTRALFRCTLHPHASPHPALRLPMDNTAHTLVTTVSRLPPRCYSHILPTAAYTTLTFYPGLGHRVIDSDYPLPDGSGYNPALPCLPPRCLPRLPTPAPALPPYYPHPHPPACGLRVLPRLCPLLPFPFAFATTFHFRDSSISILVPRM